MNEKEFNDFIMFSDKKEYIKNQLEKEEWITVYQLEKQEKNGYRNIISLYPCLVSEERKKKEYRKDSSWIVTMDFGRPGIVTYYSNVNFTDKIRRFISFKFFKEFYMNDILWGTFPYEKEKLNQERRKKNSKTLITKYEIKRFLFEKTKNLIKHKSKKLNQYYRFGEKGIEPLVHIRDFERSNFPRYIEISEEFRHYFDLYEDKNWNIFLSSDKSGNPIEVIKIFNDSKMNDEKVQIKKKYLNEFLFVKKIWLCIQFQYSRNFKEKLTESINEEFQSKDKNLTYCIKSGNPLGKHFTRFRGRKFIKYKDINFFMV